MQAAERQGRDAIVVGGGVVGLCCALRLAEAGLRVTVLDASPERDAASWGNAGHIATEQVDPLASPAMLRTLPRRLFASGGPLDLPLGMIAHWGPFAWRLLAASTPRRFAAGRAALTALLADALPAWRRLATALGRPELVRADGHLVAWEDAARAAARRAAWMKGPTGTARVTPADDRERARVEDLTTRPIAGMIRFEGTGQVTDLGALADALEAGLRAAGGTIVRRRAALELVGGMARVDGVTPDLVLVAAGIGARGLMAALGHSAPLIAERGYHIRGRADRWPSDLPPIVWEDRSIIVTRYADRVQVAGFVELGGADAPPDQRKWERLERHVRDLGLPIAGPFERWMGARPTLPDYLPAIGRSRRAANLLYAFGHQHLGLTLAPVTAEIVRALACGDTPPLDLSPFDIGRFGA